MHTGYKPFKCDKCEREFTRLDSYKNHVRLHTGFRPYKCEECGKSFNYLTTYKRHQNIHSGERPYSCDQCGRKFTRLIYVRNHKQNNCGKPKGKKAQEKSANQVVTGNETTVLEVNELGKEIKIADGSTIENIAHDLSMQGGVQLNLTKVIYTNGETQPVLIESNETTSHTLILTTNPEDGQQILELATGVSNNKAESRISLDAENNAGTLFLAQSLAVQPVASDLQRQNEAIAAVSRDENAQNLVREDARAAEDNYVDTKLDEVKHFYFLSNVNFISFSFTCA